MRYSDIYEEMEVFNDEFYVEPLPDSEEPFRAKKRQGFIIEINFMLSRVAMLGCQCSNQFLTTLCMFN